MTTPLYSANLFAGQVRLSGGGGGAPSPLFVVPDGHTYVILSMDIVDLANNTPNTLFFGSSDVGAGSGYWWTPAENPSNGYLSYRGRKTLNASVEVFADDNQGDGWNFSIDGYDLVVRA